MGQILSIYSSQPPHIFHHYSPYTPHPLPPSSDLRRPRHAGTCRRPPGMSWFSRLVADTVSAAVAKVKEVAADLGDLSLDSLQDKYGDVDGRRALYEGLDLTYLTPSLIGEWRVCGRRHGRGRAPGAVARAAAFARGRARAHPQPWASPPRPTPRFGLATTPSRWPACCESATTAISWCGTCRKRPTITPCLTIRSSR